MLMHREATFDDLCLVEGRAEIFNGRIVMLDAGGFAHSRAAMYIVGSCSSSKNERGLATR